MIKSALKLAVVLIIGVLVYNFFLGTEEEKQNSKAIFREVKDVAVGVKELVKSEKKKFDAGKYDRAIEKIGVVLQKLKKTAKEIDDKYIDRIDDLAKKRKALQEELASFNSDENDTSRRKERKNARDTIKIQRELDDLMKETESLIRQMENN